MPSGASSAALTVTVCAVCQSFDVKVSGVVGSTVTSLVAPLTVMVTLDVGSEVSATVYVPSPPFLTPSDVRLNLTPRVSSSAMVPVTARVDPPPASSTPGGVGLLKVSVKVSSNSSTLSPVIGTRTVCEVLLLAGKVRVPLCVV